MSKVKILWADDEIDLLKPHVMFLEEKGYEVTTAQSGDEAYDLVLESYFDIVFLDENMPGLSGLETLKMIKEKQHSLPVIMITKSEEESIMEDAIGSQISDYLIKPVNPKQILLSVKKHLDNRKLVSEKTNSAYQQEFRNIGMRLMDRLDKEDWKELYKKLVYWELELSKGDQSMDEILSMQKKEANNQFFKYVEDNYLEWVNGVSDDTPTLSHTLFQNNINPIVKKEPCFMLLIDNLRYDQWKMLQPLIERHFIVERDDLFFSILPTATHYARNAISQV